MNVQRIAGICLLWIGFLSGALATVQRPDGSGPEFTMAQRWQTINWQWYIGSFAISALGVTIIWTTRKTTSRQTASFERQLANQREAIDQLIDCVGELQSQLDHWPPSKIRDCIDDRCVAPLAEFADARMAIAHRHGMASFAELMSDFAMSERYINRAWSAAADGYLDEVRACLEIAADKLAHLKVRFGEITQSA